MTHGLADAAIAAQRWHLFGQPHRPCFTAAACLWAVAATAWALPLCGLVAVDPARAAELTVVHALVFGLGPMPLFVAGFIATAGPKWLRAPPLPTRALVPGTALALLGWLGVIGAAAVPHTSAAAVAPGLGLAAAGWAALAATLRRMRRAATAADRLHAELVLGACTLMPAVLLAGALALAVGDLPAARALALGGLWAIVVPIFVTAAHRLLPMFDADLPAALARHAPRASLWLMLAGCAAMGLLAPWPAGHEPPALRLLAGAVALAPAALGLHLSWHWARSHARRQAMVAMLHRGLVWWTLAWLGFALALAPGLDPAWRSRLATAALHALMLGFLGGTMLAMVTRVTAAHAGRARPFDGVARALELLLQGATLARVAAALAPGVMAVGLVLAALGWAALAAGWLVRHVPALLHGPPARPAPPALRPGRADPAPSPDLSTTPP